MFIVRPLLSPAIVIGLLAACSQQKDENTAETMHEERGQMANGGMMGGDLERQMAQMSGPFANAERKMYTAMRDATGVDFSDSWVRKMIAHHQGAVDMARIYLEQEGGRADVRDMAEGTIDKQTQEIAELEKIVREGNRHPAGAEPYASAERDMMHGMMAAARDDVSASFLGKMLEHDKGAVALSEVFLAQGGDHRVEERARQIRDDQRKEASEVEEMMAK